MAQNVRELSREIVQHITGRNTIDVTPHPNSLTNTRVLLRHVQLENDVENMVGNFIKKIESTVK